MAFVHSLDYISAKFVIFKMFIFVEYLFNIQYVLIKMINIIVFEQAYI